MSKDINTLGMCIDVQIVHDTCVTKTFLPISIALSKMRTFSSANKTVWMNIVTL